MRDHPHCETPVKVRNLLDVLIPSWNPRPQEVEADLQAGVEKENAGSLRLDEVCVILQGESNP